MRVLITVAVWGRKYAAAFADYALASQLSANNLPRLAATHQITYHIVTTGADRDWLVRQPAVRHLDDMCRIHWDLIESHGINLDHVPTGFDDKKYVFLSQLQNFAFALSPDYDALVFNYADFVWADGSLSATLAQLNDDADAVLSFCLPVDRKSGMRALDSCRDAGSGVLALPGRMLARIAIDHLHRDAQLHFWDASRFTARPTYLLWRVTGQGVLIRAYHQTVLALRIKHADASFRLGIMRGSLDGYFTSHLATQGRVRHAVDSDDVLVISLYDAPYSAVLREESREQALARTLESAISQSQRRFAEVAIRVKAECTDVEAWRRVEQGSGLLLRHFHAVTPFDADAFERLHVETSDLDNALRQRTFGDWIYRTLLLRLAHSTFGGTLKGILGESSRSLRHNFERWIYRSKR